MVLFWASTTIFPFQVFITLHLHYGDSIYLCFQSSCSLIYLLHCHIFFFFLPLASNLPMASASYRTKFIFSSKSYNGFYYLAFVHEVLSSYSWFLEKGLLAVHMALFLVGTFGLMLVPLPGKPSFAGTISTCSSRYGSILHFLCLHVWVRCLN